MFATASCRTLALAAWLVVGCAGGSRIERSAAGPVAARPVAPSGPPASVPIGTNLLVRPIEGASAWVVTHATPIAANSLVFVTADGQVILADTPWTPAATRELLDWVEARFGRRPALATVSHFHFDASGGVAALEEAGVPVVASRTTVELLAERGASMQAELERQHGADFAGWRPPAPDHPFDPAAGYRTRVGDIEVQVLFVGPAHSPDNVVTWFPGPGLLFGGCMVKGGDSLGYLGDADVPHYAAAIDRLLALHPRIVVSGHGDRTDPAQLDNTRALALRAAGGAE